LWRRSLIGMCLAGIAILATWGGVQMIPQWAGTERGPLVNIWSSAGAIIGSFLGAVIGDRFGRRVGYFVLCLLSLGVCQLLFVGMSDTAFGWDFFAVVAIVGACSAAFYGWLPLYLPELFPTRVRATGQGFAFNGGRMVAAAGVLLTGFAIPLEGRFDKAAAIVCSIYIVGLVVAWFIPETKGQPLPE
jgi:MFS family permease